MKMNIKKTLAVTALALSSGLFAVNSQAIGVNGSAGLGNTGVVETGSDLLNPVNLAISNIFQNSSGNFGDLNNAILNGAFLSFGTTNLAFGNIGSGNYFAAGTQTSQFNIVGPATWGSFIASSVQMVTQTSSNLYIYALGTFNPGTAVGAGGLDPTTASLRWTFNQSGSSVSSSTTFNSPAVPVNAPEPVTLSMLGLGLVGWAASRRKAA